MIGQCFLVPSISDEELGPCFPLHVSFLFPYPYSLVEDIRKHAK